MSREIIQKERAAENDSAQYDEGKAPAKALRFVFIVLLLLLLAGLLTVLSKYRDARALAKETAQNAILTVAVVNPTVEKADEELVLPATLQPYVESPIYARTNGYLLRWYKDIGSPVKKGELLAQIDTPEVDQELLQAKASREQIVAQMQLARISAERWQNLRKSDSVSQQEADQQTSAYQQAKANLQAADANVRRLEQLESFKNVYAPFSGVLTRRNVDPGALINAGASGRELFDVAQTDPLRVFVSVPQSYAPAIHIGSEAWVTLEEMPGQKFSGKVTHTADAIDPATRTLLTEVDVSNRNGKLLPGSFGQVHFAQTTKSEQLLVPVNAMLFRKEGPRLAVVGNDGKVQLRPIAIGKDFGTTLEILEGISKDDHVIINPSDSIEDGQQVNVVQQNGGPQG
jgi:multidrug efflux system membrane fusion protein